PAPAQTRPSRPVQQDDARCVQAHPAAVREERIGAEQRSRAFSLAKVYLRTPASILHRHPHDRDAVEIEYDDADWTVGMPRRARHGYRSTGRLHAVRQGIETAPGKAPVLTAADSQAHAVEQRPGPAETYFYIQALLSVRQDSEVCGTAPAKDV